MYVFCMEVGKAKTFMGHKGNKTTKDTPGIVSSVMSGWLTIVVLSSCACNTRIQRFSRCMPRAIVSSISVSVAFSTSWCCVVLLVLEMMQAQTPCSTKLENVSLSWETPGQLQGFKTPNPETPRKKLKNYLPGPDPKVLKNTQKKLKNTKNTRKILFWGIFNIVWDFFKKFGVGGLGARGVIFFVFLRNFGVLSPCSWPGVSQSLSVTDCAADVHGIAMGK